MATAAEVQAQLDPTGLAAQILEFTNAVAKQNVYVQGGIGYAGRTMWCETTAADDASTQAAAITTQMQAFR